MATDDQKARLDLLPSFTQPTPPTTTSLDPPTATEWTDPEPEGRRRFLPFGQSRRRPGGDDTPTGSSSPASEPIHKPTPAETAVLVAALLSMLVSGAALAVRWRTRRRLKLRRPSTKQTESVAGPLARLALRHADASWLNADLADLLTAGAATGWYLTDGELLIPDQPDPGVPEDLQEAYE